MLAVLVFAILLDLMFGEPLWQTRIPLHPTVWINTFVKKIVPFFANKEPTLEKFNGVLLALITITLVAIPTFLILKLFQLFHILLYVVFAALTLKLTLCIKLETQMLKVQLKQLRIMTLQRAENASLCFHEEKWTI